MSVPVTSRLNQTVTNTQSHFLPLKMSCSHTTSRSAWHHKQTHRWRRSSGVPPCEGSVQPCGPPAPVLLSGGTGIKGCRAVPDRAASPWRHYAEILAQRETEVKIISDWMWVCGVIYWTAPSSLTFICLLTNLWAPCIRTFCVGTTQEKTFTWRGTEEKQ